MRINALDAGLGDRADDGDAESGRLVDGIVLGVAAVDEDLIWARTCAAFHLGDHRRRLAQIGAGLGHVEADDDTGTIGGGRELDIVGWAEAAIAHLHDAGIGIGGRDTGDGVFGPALLLGRDDLGELRQRGVEARHAVLCGTLLSGQASRPEGRVAAITGDGLEMRSSGVQKLLERGPAATRCGAARRASVASRVRGPW
jgi:hypothetical protein